MFYFTPYQPECLVFVICVKTGLFNALKIVSIPPGLFQHIHVLTNQIYSIIKSYILKPSDCKAYLFVIWLYKWFLWQKKPSFTIPLRCSPKTFLTPTHSTFLHSWQFRRSTEPGFSFEAGCRRNSTYTLYSAAGYFLCMKDKKCVIP
jgi:hypothetical protein